MSAVTPKLKKLLLALCFGCWSGPREREREKERHKGITEHKVSFLEIARKTDLENGQDRFNLCVKSPMKFKCVKDPRAASGQEFCSELEACEGPTCGAQTVS